MKLEEFKNQLHAIFESCDYTEQLSEEEKKVPFTYTSPEGVSYQVEVEPNEQEFYVYQDGKQVDLFNTSLVDVDGSINKATRQAIANEWKNQQSGKAPAPINTATPEEPVSEKTPIQPSVSEGEPVPTTGEEQPIAETADINKNTDEVAKSADIGDEFHNKTVKHKKTGKLGKVASFGNLRHTQGSQSVQVWWQNPDGSWDKNPEMNVDKRLLDIQPENTLTEQQLNEVAEIIKKFQDQYGSEKGKEIYYATANKQNRDPETFKKD